MVPECLVCTRGARDHDFFPAGRNGVVKRNHEQTKSLESKSSVKAAM